MTGGNGPFYFSRYSRSSLSHPGTVRLTRLAKQKGLLNNPLYWQQHAVLSRGRSFRYPGLDASRP